MIPALILNHRARDAAILLFRLIEPVRRHFHEDRNAAELLKRVKRITEEEKARIAGKA